MTHLVYDDLVSTEPEDGDVIRKALDFLRGLPETEGVTVYRWSFDDPGDYILKGGK